MDGAQGFAEALNYLPLSARSDVLRLDQATPGPLPDLDDITQLPMLSSLAFTVSDELVRTMLASATFFFEMDEFPKNQGMLHCRGSVLCTHPRSAEIVHCVLTEFPGAARFQTGMGEHLGNVDLQDCCTGCGYFRKEITFWVHSLEEEITIEIADKDFHHRIGGMPKSVHDLLANQKAYTPFGRPDHQMPVWPPNRRCYCMRGQKRRIQIEELSSKRRKMEL
jgi:hypothetical protein